MCVLGCVWVCMSVRPAASLALRRLDHFLSPGDAMAHPATDRFKATPQMERMKSTAQKSSPPQLEPMESATTQKSTPAAGAD